MTHRRTQRRARAAAVLVGAVGSLLVACTPSGVRASFDSPDPSAKLFAIERAAREGDMSAVPRIIEQLDSGDPAVRLIAIAALERLTGETFGYRHYAPRAEREKAIQRWVEAAQTNGFGEAAEQLAGGSPDG